MASSYRPDSEESPDEGVVAEINITPLTDVFLVLLIIFMVTTSVIQDESKNIDLPTASESDETPSGVTVAVDDSGTILVNDRKVTADELPAALEAALEAADQKIVILRGDKSVLLGQAVDILDTAQRLGARGIALATRQPD